MTIDSNENIFPSMNLEYLDISQLGGENGRSIRGCLVLDLFTFRGHFFLSGVIFCFLMNLQFTA